MASAKKLPSGSWRVNLFIGIEGGKRKYKSFTASTKKEAEYLAAQYNQLHIDINRNNCSLSQLIEGYIESKENILSPSTIRGYYTILNNYLPSLMATKIKDITPHQVQSEFNIFAKDYSPKTCRNAHGLIVTVLSNERPDLVLKTTLPPKKKRNIYVPDETEITKLYPLVKGKKIEIPFMLAAECGLRASEIAALKVSNVHKDYIHIKEALVPDKNNKPALKPPKSYNGNRKVPISKSMYKALMEHAENERVCNMTDERISNAWGKFKNKNNLNGDFNFHALRHHYASKCLLLGLPQKYIAELMGHCDTRMIEQVYQHIFPSAMENYANLLRKSTETHINSPKSNATQKATQSE